MVRSGGVCYICWGCMFGDMYTLYCGVIAVILEGSMVMARLCSYGDWVGNVATLGIGANPGGGGILGDSYGVVSSINIIDSCSRARQLSLLPNTIAKAGYMLWSAIAR